MRNYLRTLLTTILVFVLLLSCGRKAEEVQVLPGRGIAFNGDTVEINKTSEKEVVRIFNICNNNISTDTGIACGFTEDGEPTSFDSHHRTLHHRGMEFIFSGNSDQNSLLEEIVIRDSTDLNVLIKDSLRLGKLDPKVYQYFPPRMTLDTNTVYWYNLDSYGLDIGLSDYGRAKRLSYISIHSPVDQHQ
jgi:hypothetical protein